MCHDVTPVKHRKSREKMPKPGLKNPSMARLRSQHKIIESNNRKHQGLSDEKKLIQSYPLFQPIRSKTKPNNDSLNIPEYDSDATLPPEADEKPKDTLLDGPVKEYSVKMKTFGIRKPVEKKRSRYYRCPVCKSKFGKLAELNRHYKDSHPPLTCSSCDCAFSTPSTLEQHSYKHKDLKFKCSVCGKGFPFASNHDSHELSHTTEKKFKCKDCDKAYINKGDLVKHEKTHTKKMWQCRICDYSNCDERNLKLHMRKHSNLMPYLCEKCLKLFKYHMQLKRHLPYTGTPPIKRSSNPDY